jgi:hypothetical protein
VALPVLSDKSLYFGNGSDPDIMVLGFVGATKTAIVVFGGAGE